MTSKLSGFGNPVVGPGTGNMEGMEALKDDTMVCIGECVVVERL